MNTTKRLAFYIGTVLILGLVFFGPFPGGIWNSNTVVASYQEECLGEGCNGEEVREMYQSYQSECLDEGCSKEEVFELAGSANAANAMLIDFRNRGFKVDPAHFQGVNPNCTGTTTFCTGVLLWCDDHCTFPDGTTSSPYVCGGCIGVSW